MKAAAAFLCAGLVGTVESVQPGPAGSALPALSVTSSYSASRRLDDGAACTQDTLKEHLTTITSECCFAPDGTEINCADGPPIQCTASCAEVFVPFWSVCKIAFSTMELQFSTFDAQCKTTGYNDAGTGDIGSSVIDPTVCLVRRSDDTTDAGAPQQTFSWVEISPLQMDHCIGATPQEQIDCGIAPPRVGITAEDVGTLIGSSDWTSGGQNTWAGDDGWLDVTLPWDFTWYGANENVITIGTNGVLTFGEPQYRFGGSEPVPCHGNSMCSDNSAHGIGMDGVIAVMWTDLNPAEVTDCPQTHHCTGGGNVFYQISDERMVIEYAKVQSWSWNNQYGLSDPGQTFEVILWRNGDVLMQYLDMYCEHCSTAWSTVSIGFEDQEGLRGQQIEYGDIPPDSTAFFIPRVCHTVGGAGGGGGSGQ